MYRFTNILSRRSNKPELNRRRHTVREEPMAEVVVIGAGLSGTLMAYELLPQLRKDDRLTVVSQGAVYHFVPSNPWVAIGWRKQIQLLTQGAQRVHPSENRVELGDGTSINYDYLVIATGPELAFDEIPGLGPQG